MKALSEEIRTLCTREIDNSKLHKKIIKELLVENGIPMDITSDILTLKKDPLKESKFVQYHILRKLNANAIPKYFSQDSINACENTKYENLRIEFPLEFEVVEIKEKCQWIGKIDARTLMELGDAGLINYNENAQRILKRITVAGEEAYRININKKAVQSIKTAMENDRYIPNTITLNIPDGSDFHYNPKTNRMKIKNIEAFDILDGYHRYIAISSIYAMNSDFNCPMELRLTNYPDEIARQFIWQEDQKTRMSKVDSDSFNKYDAGNMVVDRIKANIAYGSLVSSKGIINDAVLAKAIRKAYKVRTDKNYKVSDIRQMSEEIIKGFDELLEENENLFDNPIDAEQIMNMVKEIVQKGGE